MNLLTIDNFSKSYTDRMLFDDTSFSIQENEKVGVIGTNGMGKSTLLKIVAGVDVPDTGKVIMGNHVKIGYLHQNPVFKESDTVLTAAISGMNGEDLTLIAQAKAMLNKLGIDNFDQNVNELSGGQKKRVSLVNTLLLDVELLVLDEPTNHLDNEMSTWLEEYLTSYKGAVIMVTHDRYFLDRVVTRIVEVDKGKIYSYPGSYAEFVGLRMQRQNIEYAAERKRKSILRKELAWLARGARARSTKQKAHIQRIENMLEMDGPEIDGQVTLYSVASRMGKKTIELNGLSKAFAHKKLIEDFTYYFLKNDRVGIVGENGTGKSTLIKMIVGELKPDDGFIEIGDTIRIGYFAQDNVHMDEEMKAIEYVREEAEYIDTEDGKITASAMMERFLFDGATKYSKIGKLSGGERRRLYLMRILMQSPNVLIFDEPTNDLDIQTLNVLEDYLDSFDGIIIIVSHDRYFLDRIVNRIFSLDGNGVISRYEGNYSDYLKSRAERFPERYNQDGTSVKISGKSVKKTASEDANDEKKKVQVRKKVKFSFNEQREFDTIDDVIASLEEKLEKCQNDIEANATNSLKLKELMEEQEKIQTELDEKMERWIYLNELAEKMQE